MIEFLPVKADLKNNSFENIKFLPFILDLFFKNKSILIDDYYPQEDSGLLDFIVEEINSLYPWFLVGVCNDEPIGTAWISHFHGGQNKYHSCQIHGCVDRKFFGEKALFALNELIDFISINIGIRRVQMEIPEFNKKALAFAKRAGFQEEGLLRCATLKGEKPLNHFILSKIVN